MPISYLRRCAYTRRLRNHRPRQSAVNAVVRRRPPDHPRLITGLRRVGKITPVLLGKFQPVLTLGMRPLVAHCTLGLANLHARAGQHAQASEHLATATALYREMDMRFWLKKA